MKQDNSQLIRRHAYFNQRFFAKWAKLYDYEKYFLYPLRNKAARFFGAPNTSKIIDIATGTGAQVYALAKLGYEVTGIDLSKEMLAQAKKKKTNGLKLSFLHADATNLPFKTNTFDAATISLGLHDMPYEIRLLVLREMIRVTKPEGTLMIVDYLEPRTHPIAKFAYYLERLYETPMFEDFVHRGLLAHLEEVGLKVNKKTTFLGLSQIVVCTNRKN